MFHQAVSKYRRKNSNIKRLNLSTMKKKSKSNYKVNRTINIYKKGLY